MTATPNDDPLEVSALSLPARAYTGDFYFSRRVDGALWFAPGDVAGKGIASAVFMAMIQETLESAQRHGLLVDDLTLLIPRYRPWANSAASFPISGSIRSGRGV